ncbi:polyketide synthase [Marinibacterium sp. SX1]|uniref:beta-ketoacyl [acyl carrier protein] synthase domain-containing protein n=1 Tax=Marinibacterium sp. SX1 TaxID=3388424 RepID=UPI003D185781
MSVPPRPEPIAVVGMACRFPGADSPDALARLLRAGATSVAPVPDARRALWATGQADTETLWSGIHARHAGLIDGIETFDRLPFRISATEVPLVDPMQRLALETGWHALEDAGLAPAELEDRPVGVFMGAAASDYTLLLTGAGLPGQGHPHLPNAGQNGAISGRLSYCLGLVGPSYTVDTACSAALSAVALAGEALQAGRCDIVLAGGVNALLAGSTTAILCAGPVLSPTGETRSFDAGAAGFVRGEGCGMLVLKRLGDARADGDRIHAVLPGWATGQDGRSNGLSAPSRAGQARVITEALRRSGLAPDAVGYIEAHGSATALGDVIETQALGDAHAGRTGAPGGLGSIKAVMGHLEAAAGIAGLIKAIVMVRDGFVPSQPLFDRPNPRIDWAALPFRVPQATADWPGARRVAGVSAFGMSGMNAHVLVASVEAADAGDAAAAGGASGAGAAAGAFGTAPVGDEGATPGEPGVAPVVAASGAVPVADARGGGFVARAGDGSGTASLGDAEDAAPVTAAPGQGGGGPQLFLLSAANGPAIQARAAQLAETLRAAPPEQFAALAAATCRRWTGLSHRAGFLAADPAEALARLAVLTDAPPARAPRAPRRLALALPPDLPADLAAGLAPRLAALCPGLALDAGAELRIADVPEAPDRPRALLLNAALALSLAGASVATDALYPPALAKAVALPPYPFQRQRAWFDDLPGTGAVPGTRTSSP